jgi:hypothetical protein
MNYVRALCGNLKRINRVSQRLIFRLVREIPNKKLPAKNAAPTVFASLSSAKQSSG